MFKIGKTYDNKKSLENAKFILSNNNIVGACYVCTPYDLNLNDYDYCFYCKLILIKNNNCNKYYKSIMAKQYLDNSIKTIKGNKKT